MATKNLSQHSSKPESKANYEYGLAKNQLNILSNISDAVEGLNKALASKNAA